MFSDIKFSHFQSADVIVVLENHLNRLSSVVAFSIKTDALTHDAEQSFQLTLLCIRFHKL